MNARALFVSIAFCALPTHAFAWGPLGHSVVAMLTEPMLKAQARDNVRKILLGAPLLTAVNFADEYRNTHPETERWHYVDIPDNEASTLR